MKVHLLKTISILYVILLFPVILVSCKSKEEERKEKLIMLLQTKRGFEMTLKTFNFEDKEGKEIKNTLNLELDKVQYSIDSLMLINQLDK